MKIVCRKDVLSENIGVVSKAVSNRTTLPILECVLVKAAEGGVKLLANDLELAIETKPIEAEVIEAGEIALDAKVFFDIVRRLPGEEVYIETLNNYVTVIRSGVSEFKILGQPGDEFPLLPVVEAEVGFEIASGEMKNMIRQTIFSVSTDESRPAITGELFTVNGGELKIASTDAFRVSLRTSVIDNKELQATAIVPGKTLGEVSKILESGEKAFASVYFSDKHMMFETDSALVVSRLIEGRFLDIENVFTTECTTEMKVNTQELLSCLERASLISREAKKNPVKLSVDKDRQLLTVESNTEMGAFHEEISVEIDGLSLEIAFNPKYLSDIFRVVEDGRVKLLFTTPLSPCVIKSAERDDYKYLVLPLRVMN